MTLKQLAAKMLIAVTCIACSKEGWVGQAMAETRAVKEAIRPLAVIDGKPISPDSFVAELTRHGGADTIERKEQLLDRIIRSELLLAAARKAGYESDPEVIAAVKQAMVAKYLRDNLEPKMAQVKVTDQEVEAYYRSHQAEFGTLPAVHAALIRIAVSPKTDEEKKAELRERAEIARREALALEPGVPAFGNVAVTYSEDAGSRYRGGDIGWLQAGAIDGRWDQRVSEGIFALRHPGDVSPVISAADGFYIVKLMEIRGATVKPFTEVKDGARYLLLQEKRRHAEGEFMALLRKNIPVTVDRGLLANIASPVAAPPALPAR